MYGAAQWHEGVHCTFEKGAKIAGERLLFERGEVSIRASRLLMHAEFDLSSPCILSNFGSSKGQFISIESFKNFKKNRYFLSC